jgi:bacterioferritin (cytochrome b1)
MKEQHRRHIIEMLTIARYSNLIDLCGEAHDCVTRDLCSTRLADEEGHRETFAGYRKEYTKQ